MALEPDFAEVLGDASVDRASLGRIVDAVAEKLGADALFRNFLGVMAAKRRLGVLPQTLNAFHHLVAEHRGEATAEITSAAPLTETQEEALLQALSEASGKSVHMKVEVDPALIGGLVVKLGSKMIDASVRSKLANLQNALKEVG